MAKLGDLFPSKYLKASDFEDADETLTISMLKTEMIGQGKDAGEKPVLYFEEVDKGLVLNKTNAGTIAKLYGGDTDDWVGKRVTLFHTEVQFQSEMVEAIRIRSKPPKKTAAPKPVPHPAEDGDPDADIPF